MSESYYLTFRLEKMRQVAQKAMDLRGTLKKVKSGIFKIDEDEHGTNRAPSKSPSSKTLDENSNLDQEIEAEAENEAA